MTRIGRWHCVLSLAFLGIVAVEARAQPSDELDRQQAMHVIAQLDDPDPAVRRSASFQVNNLGPGALEPVAAAVKDSASPEARVRLLQALRYLRPRATIERAERARMAWESQIFTQSFKAAPGHNARFDADFAAGLEAFLAIGPDFAPRLPEARQKAVGAFRHAILAGCDDPLPAMMLRLVDQTAAASPPRNYKHPNDPLTEILHGPYPAAIKFRMVGEYAAAQITTREHLQILTDLTPDALREGGQSRAEVEMVLGWVISAQKTPQQWEDELHKLIDDCRKLEPQSDFPLLAACELRRLVANERRWLQGLRGAFDAANRQQYLDALHSAASNIEEAFAAHPSNWRLARERLELAYNLDEVGDDRAQLQKWFDTATTLNPDDRAAFEQMARYLSPSEHGSLPALLKFGRECLASQNWRAGIPFIVLFAHERGAEATGDRQIYFGDPQVWGDVQEVYTGLLVNQPENLYRRCEYAKYAALCGHWDVAHHQLQIIGDHPIMSVFGSEASYDYLRRKAQRLATTNPSTGEKQ